MQKLMNLATAIAVSAMFALVGVAGTALADKDDPVNPKVHKEDVKHQYVNLGIIGDIITACGVLPTETGDITVPDGTRGGSITLLPSQPIDLPGISEETFCLGGAIAPYDPSEPRDSWDIWIHDYIWNGCDTYTIPAQDGLCPVQPQMGWGIEGIAEQALELGTGQGWTVELKSAGLARTDTTYDLPVIEKAPGDDALNCVPVAPNTDPENGPRACLQEVGGQGASRNSNQFGFCGQGSIDSGSGMVDPFDISGGPQSGSATNVQVNKVVFTDGLALYQLDCPLTGPVTGTIKPFYDLVADLVNSVTCPVPVININVFCLFDLPAVGSGCFFDKTGDNFPVTNQINLPVVALVGEIGWTHQPTDTCKDTPTHNDWIYDGPGLSLVIKGVEPTACVSATYVGGGFGLIATSCLPADCTLTIANGPLGGTSNASCVAEDACDGKLVQTTAALLISVPMDTASADVLCDGTSIYGGANAFATNPTPLVDQSAKVVKPTSGDYECDMTYTWVNNVVPYLAVAACHDDP